VILCAQEYGLHRVNRFCFERLAAAVLCANDEFFAPKENLLKPAAPIFIEGKYTEPGQVRMAGDRRRRNFRDWTGASFGSAAGDYSGW